MMKNDFDHGHDRVIVLVWVLAKVVVVVVHSVIVYPVCSLYMYKYGQRYYILIKTEVRPGFEPLTY